MVIYIMYIWIHYNDLTVTSECWLGFGIISKAGRDVFSRIFR